MTKPNIRWQLLLALAALGLVVSLLSFQIRTTGLCSTRVPAGGGYLVEGVVGVPRTLNPLLADANPVSRELSSLLFDGLTRYDENGKLVPALARDWHVDDDGRTVHVGLRDDVTWHDGEPFTAEDVVFTYGLLQDEAFPAPAGLKALWQTVTISSTGELSVTFTLPEPYSPFLDATTRGILPAHLLADVPAGEIPDHDFNHEPVGTGPFMMLGGDNWERTGRLHLVPEPGQWRQGVRLDGLEFRFYPDEAALLEAFAEGEVNALNRVSTDALPRVISRPGVRLFTAPRPRYTQLLFNLTDTGMPAVREIEVRQALAYALDRERIIDQAINGQGLLLDGPYLPSSWAYNPAQLTHYGYRPVSATALLDTAGWSLAGEASVRQQEDTPLTLRLLLLDDPGQRSLGAAIAQYWSEVGVGTQLVAVSGDELATALAERDFDVALVDVAPSGDPDLYDFWSQEALIRGQNYAGWNNRRASEALERGRQVWDVAARRAYYDAFLRYFDNDLPALTLYQHVYTYAVGDTVQALEIGRIDSPRDRYETLPNWFLHYRDVTVSCPDDGE